MNKEEYILKYGQEKYDELREYHRKWAKEHREQCNRYQKKWYDKDNTSTLKSQKKYRTTHKEAILDYKKNTYHNRKETRAYSLYQAYKRSDDLRRGGGCTITKQWILEHVYSGQVCCYCNCSDWKQLGLDRINNNLPHTPDNVVVSCTKCNNKRHEQNYYSFRYGVTDWNELHKQLIAI